MTALWLLPLLAFVVAAPSYAGDWPFTFTHPDTSVDGTPLTDLHHTEAVLFRCPNDSLRLADIPAIGAEGDSVGGTIDALDGAVYWLRLREVDFSGNKSAPVSHTFALPAVETPPPPPPDTSGTGIVGRYYRGLNRNTFIASRRDTSIAFAWGTGSPGMGVPADSFSVEWDGEVYIPETGAWEFCIESEDGAQVYIDWTYSINHYEVQPVTEWCKTFALTAGWHGLHVNYMARLGNAQVALRYAGPGFPKVIIPRSALR